MNYIPLSKLFYQNKEEYQKQLVTRRSSPSTVLLPFNIRSDQAYYLVLPEFSLLQGNVFSSYLEFHRIFYTLPEAARDFYSRGCLVDEVVLTNELEGVHISRRDILTVLSSEDKPGNKLRFDGLIKKYLLLTEYQADVPVTSLKDIRELYDEIVAPEIPNDDLPDGEYFRKETVYVHSATDRVKHTGVVGESHINECMQQALTILNDTKQTPLLRIAVFHYLFGYIHPFYDGNGRLSRFISSVFLAKEFDPIVAFRLSYTIKQNKKKYYEAFDLVNDRNSGGDITPFIILFSEIIAESISSMKDEIEEVSAQLDYYRLMLKDIQNKDYQNYIFFLVQNTLFSSDPLTIKDLMSISRKSDPTVRKIISELSELGVPLIKSKHGRADAYSLDLNALEDFLKNHKL